MSSFFGMTVSASSPITVEPDPVGDINITAASVSGGKEGKASMLKICADDGDAFTLATLVPGSRDHQCLDVQLGAGNEKVVFSVVGGAKIDLTGYVTIPEEYGAMESDDDEEDDEEEEASDEGAVDERELARTMFGTARLAGSDEESYDSSDDESFDDEEEERAAKLLYANSSDEDSDEDSDDDEEDDSDDDDEDDSDEDEDEDDDDDEFGVKPFLKKPQGATPAPSKKRKAASPAAETPASKKPTGEASKKKKVAATTPIFNPLHGAAATPESKYKETIAAYLKANGPSPLSKVGNNCKRPADLPTKLKGFITANSDTFAIDDGQTVRLA